MGNPVVEQYLNEPWLIYPNREPEEASKKRLEEQLRLAEAHPIAPGEEQPFPPDPTPENMTRRDLRTPGGFAIYEYKYKEADPNEKRVIFYVHGGGFMRGNGMYCRANAITQAKYFGLTTYCNEYRYIPKFKYPAGLDDVEEGWDYLVEKLGIDPENIILTGESAGGTYVLALTARLKRKGRKLPGKILVISGFLDLDWTGPSYTYNKPIDPVFSTTDIEDFSRLYTDEKNRKDPEISPFYADFTGFPPTFFTADDHEVFASDALQVADKMHKLGIPVGCFLGHALMHAFPLEIPELAESKAAFAAAKEFLL